MNKDFLNSFAHYKNVPKFFLMLGVAVGAIVFCLWLLYLTAKVKGRKYNDPVERIAYVRLESLNLAERFYELLISATLILLFVGIYFSIDYFGIYEPARPYWQKYNSIILLVFILLAIMINSWIDSKIIPLTFLMPGDQASMRLIGMLYMLAIFVYIKFIYEDNNYDDIILYFIAMVVGRFVYFDATFESFAATMKSSFSSLPLLFPALMCSGLIAYAGFTSGFLIRWNGVVMNLFIGHCFLLPVILVINRARIFQHILPKPNETGKHLDSTKA